MDAVSRRRRVRNPGTRSCLPASSSVARSFLSISSAIVRGRACCHHLSWNDIYSQDRLARVLTPDNELLLLWIVTPPGPDDFFRETCNPPGAVKAAHQGPDQRDCTQICVGIPLIVREASGTHLCGLEPRCSSPGPQLTSESGTLRTWSDARLESVVGAKTDFANHYKCMASCPSPGITSLSGNGQ
jgi:hypothetical protein